MKKSKITFEQVKRELGEHGEIKIANAEVEVYELNEIEQRKVINTLREKYGLTYTGFRRSLEPEIYIEENPYQYLLVGNEQDGEFNNFITTYREFFFEKNQVSSDLYEKEEGIYIIGLDDYDFQLVAADEGPYGFALTFICIGKQQ